MYSKESRQLCWSAQCSPRGTYFFSPCIARANPPYIQLQKTINESTGEKLGDAYANAGFSCFAKTGDIYCLFYEKGYRLLHQDGVLTFITSNKWMRAGYGEKLRNFLSKKTNPLLLVDFGSQKVFESATVDVNILMFSKGENRKETLACTVKENCSSNLSVYIQQNNTCASFSTGGNWTILSNAEKSIKTKIESLGTPLKKWNIRINRGILTGYNEAFIISTEKKDELIAADPRSAEIIRPILRGRDIKRYEYTFAQLWLIATFPSRKYDIDDFPAVKQHLLSYGIERLEQTGKLHVIAGEKVKSRKKTNNKWFETQDSINYWNDFFRQKIVYREISDAMDACLVEPGIMLNNKCYLITGEHLEYLLAFFNSTIFTKIILPQANITGGKGEGFLSSISSLYPTEKTEEEIRRLLQERRGCSAEEAIFVDKKIDELFFDLYDLNANERSFLNEG